MSARLGMRGTEAGQALPEEVLEDGGGVPRSLATAEATGLGRRDQWQGGLWGDP